MSFLEKTEGYPETGVDQRQVCGDLSSDTRVYFSVMNTAFARKLLRKRVTSDDGDRQVVWNCGIAFKVDKQSFSQPFGR